MAKKEKRLQKIIDAVQDILDNEPKAKKLKKAKALRRFIGKLEQRKEETEHQLQEDSQDEKTQKTLEKHLRILEEQIAKSMNILEELEQD